MKLAFVIPARNEALTVGELVRSIRYLHKRALTIVVDDGSDDLTSLIAREAKATVVLANVVQKGYAGAVLTGLRHAHHLLRSDWTCVIDAGGAWNPADMCHPELIGLEGAVLGYRERSSARLDRKLLSWAARQVASWKAGTACHDATAGFRLYSAGATSVILREPGLAEVSGHWFNAAIFIALARAGIPIGWMPVAYSGGANGLSLAEVGRALRDALKGEPPTGGNR